MCFALRRVQHGCSSDQRLVLYFEVRQHHLEMTVHRARARYSNSESCNKIFKISFFEAQRPGDFFKMKVLGVAIDSVKFSSKSELSSRFFGRLKFSALFE